MDTVNATTANTIRRLLPPMRYERKRNYRPWATNATIASNAAETTNARTLTRLTLLPLLTLPTATSFISLTTTQPKLSQT